MGPERHDFDFMSKLYRLWAIFTSIIKISRCTWVEVGAKDVMGHHSDIDIPLSYA